MSIAIDYGYCLSQHGFASNQEVDDWYAQPRPLDYRTFSPLFSPVDYLLDHPDLISSSVHPVSHYLDHGANEGRKTKPAPVLRKYKCQVSGDCLQAKVAFVQHIFYVDHVDDFLNRIRHVELPTYDVYISTTPDILASHGTVISEELGDRLKGLIAVANRGRNIQPLFVAFGDKLADYDAICHCHSKESRYTGRRRSDWADYLTSGMIGPGTVCSRHVALIMSGQCDVIAPVPYRGLPPWAMHSLSNNHHLNRLTSLLDMDQESGFMTYPVGGMFWMSRRIVAAVARLNLTIEDFPTEPTQPDGEIHHALERVIGLIAGSKLAFYDQVTACYWDPLAVLHAELLRFPPSEDLIEIVDGHDMVTFDFFDTLAYRSTADEEWAKKRVEFIFNCDYRARRNAAEAALRDRQGAGEDVPLSLISMEMLANGFADALRATALERALDLRTLRPNRSILRAYERAIERQKYVAIVSDTYYDTGFIEDFLREHDLPRPTQIVASADTGRRKDRGDIWAHLAAMRAGRRALHVGDNVHSDIQLAANFGFETFYVPHWRNRLLSISGLSRQFAERSSLNQGFGLTADMIIAAKLEEDPE